MSRSFLKYWLPVFLWMILIFSASADTTSGQRSSRIIGPFVRWLFPNISDNALNTVVHYARKTAHLAEYAVLSLLLWRALRHSRSRRGDEADSLPAGRPVASAPSSRPWRHSTAALAFAIAVLYAITDEFHQAFVPSRQGQIGDVLIDSLGAALALLGLWLFGRWRKYW